jgi:PhoPQ-activated pathogenicity-related protein
MKFNFCFTRWLHRFAVSLALIVPVLAVQAQQLPEKTDLDDYVNKPDSSYSWKVVSSKSVDGINQVVLDMISQTWLTPEQVDRPQWQHWVVINYPDKVASDVGFLMIGGGSNRDNAPSSTDSRVQQIAKAMGTAVVELKMVPNQPLIFHNDGQPRSEDDLIGYTWDQYLKTGDPTWPARNAMVKSAVRAMDAVSEYMASVEGGQQKVDKFVVSGGSKRGWTTWLTGAVDKRVVGIAPIVIDVVNANASMRHHFAAYGFWAPAVGNYVQHQIMQRMDHPRLESLYQLVDPFSYRHRLTMPKLVLNAAGDQFFLPDSSQFYWDDLQGPKALRYVPNADHGMGGTDAHESLISFYHLVMNNQPFPDFQWKIGGDGIQVQANDRPVEVRLWQATNPEARDFRMETLGKKYTSESVTLDPSGSFLAQVPVPEKGWTAYFVEATYDVGAPTPLKLTSGVHVVPEVLPFADKNPSLPTRLTAVAHASEKASVEKIQAALDTLKKSGRFPDADNVKVLVKGNRCYVNWEGDTNKLISEAGLLAGFLRLQGCDTVHFQVESGEEITLPPAADE